MIKKNYNVWKLFPWLMIDVCRVSGFLRVGVTLPSLSLSLTRPFQSLIIIHKANTKSSSSLPFSGKKKHILLSLSSLSFSYHSIFFLFSILVTKNHGACIPWLLHKAHTYIYIWGYFFNTFYGFNLLGFVCLVCFHCYDCDCN